MIARTLTIVLAVWCVLLVPRAAFAQASVRATVSATEVEVGEAFRVELVATTSSDDEASDPQLPAPNGFQLSGPRVGTQQRVSFVNGVVEHQRGITATWTLVGSRPGKYTIGPPTVKLGRARVTANPVTVHVVPAGTLPQRPKRRSRGLFFDDDFDPFGLLHGMRRGRDDPTLDPFLRQPSRVPDEYNAEEATDPIAFLRAEAVPSRAVVGQQVTLRIFAYDSRGPFEETTTSEPSRADFLSHVIVNSAHNQPMYRVDIDGRTFHAVKVREIALFPLHAGNLVIGPMKMGFRRPGSMFAPSDAVVVRRSPPVEVLVTEPPTAGRPAGYQMGNTGRFSLEASVTPRSIRAGEAVSVIVTLDGTGNLPSAPVLPVRRGVEWAKPRITEAVNPRGSVVAGTKKFSYVVRITESGNVDLGEVTLPYFDPRTGAYDTARVALGTVDVSPSAQATREDPAEVEQTPITRLLQPRTTLGPAVQRPLYLADRPWFWGLLAATPLSVVAANVLLGAGRRLRDRVASRRGSASSRVREALEKARRAASEGDGAMEATLVERALYTALEHETGIRARGVLRAELTDRLIEQSVQAGVARQLVELLDDCEAVRFTGTRTTATALHVRASALVSKLRPTSRVDRVPA